MNIDLDEIESRINDGIYSERARVVAWLRAEAFLTMYEATPDEVADAIERGEHRREEGA